MKVNACIEALLPRRISQCWVCVLLYSISMFVGANSARMLYPYSYEYGFSTLFFIQMVVLTVVLCRSFSAGTAIGILVRTCCCGFRSFACSSPHPPSTPRKTIAVVVLHRVSPAAVCVCFIVVSTLGAFFFPVIPTSYEKKRLLRCCVCCVCCGHIYFGCHSSPGEVRGGETLQPGSHTGESTQDFFHF